MMKNPKIYVILFITVLIGIAVIGFSKINESNEKIMLGKDNYIINETWELPTELDEISGITWIDNHTLACVQDEDGKIFIYDLEERKIADEIPFAGNGDYEGIAKHKNNLYIIQSDGLVYEIKNWTDTNKAITSFQTGFKSSNNMESLAYSEKEESLLTVPKDKDSQDSFKGIYKIDLQNKSANLKTPLYKVDLTNEAFKPYRGKKLHKTFNPSEIAIHPKTQEIYMLEGKNPKLVILDKNGNLKRVLKLDELNFPQPEGMSFSESGELYISNEASNGPANIHMVTLKFNKN